MALLIAAALALATDPTPNVAGTPLDSNLEYSVPIVGQWTYMPGADGGEAMFTDSRGRLQLTIRCTRSTRQIALSKAASSASPSLWVWTSAEKKTLPATYDSATGRVNASIGANDSLLDAIAFSRGRIGFSTSGLETLVVPPWPEVGRVIEDCRA
jgi:hypothetical protein